MLTPSAKLHDPISQLSTRDYPGSIALDMYKMYPKITGLRRFYVSIRQSPPENVKWQFVFDEECSQTS